jgi:hypothetical protein
MRRPKRRSKCIDAECGPGVAITQFTALSSNQSDHARFGGGLSELDLSEQTISTRFAAHGCHASDAMNIAHHTSAVHQSPGSIIDNSLSLAACTGKGSAWLAPGRSGGVVAEGKSGE